MRVHIGPLSRVDFDRFVPGGSANKALKTLLSLFALPAIEFQLNLLLRAEDILPMTFSAKNNYRLGWGLYLVSKPVTEARGTLFHLPL